MFSQFFSQRYAGSKFGLTLISIGLVGPVLAQYANTTTEPNAAAAPAPAERVDPKLLDALSGLRDYPDGLIDDLLNVSRQPGWVQATAQAIREGRQPDVSNLLEGSREAAQRLAGVPDVVLIADGNPAALQSVRAFFDQSPQRASALLGQLRDRYQELDRAAAHGWQDALEHDPVALGQYRDWLNQYSAARQRESSSFAVLRAKNRAAILAAVPSSDVLKELRRTAPDNLRSVLETWDRQYGPAARDLAAKSLDGQIPPATDDAKYVVEWPTERRSELWMQPSDNATDGDLVPAILLPPNDQPGEVRLMAAMDEQERIWGSPAPISTAVAEASPPPAAPETTPSIAPETTEQDIAAFQPPPTDGYQVETIEPQIDYPADVGIDYGTTYVESYVPYSYSYGYPAYGYTYGGYYPPVGYGHSYYYDYGSPGFSVGLSFGHHGHGAFCHCANCTGYYHGYHTTVIHNAANAHVGGHPLYRSGVIGGHGSTTIVGRSGGNAFRSGGNVIRSGDRSISTRSFPSSVTGTRTTRTPRTISTNPGFGLGSRGGQPGLRSPTTSGFKSLAPSNPTFRRDSSPQPRSNFQRVPTGRTSIGTRGAANFSPRSISSSGRSLSSLSSGRSFERSSRGTPSSITRTSRGHR